MVKSRSQGKVKLSAPCHRQGVGPVASRPHKRANGWTRCKNAVRPRSFSGSIRDRRSLAKDAFAALKPAWAIEAATAIKRSGKVRSRGLHSAATPQRIVISAITRYHSGIRGRDAYRLGAGL